MTTRPADAVFGLPDPRWEAPAASPTADLADNQNDEGAAEIPSSTEAQWVNSELQTIASTIQHLQSRLEETNSRLSDAEKVETTEYEIGRLFVEAQRFSEDSLANLELKLHEVLGAAETKAMQILTEATEEAQRIRQEAQEAAFASTQTVQELQSAISGFTAVNAELLRELGALNGMLSPTSNPDSDQLDPSSRAGLTSSESG